jgi:hypothetical protein
MIDETPSPSVTAAVDFKEFVHQKYSGSGFRE